MHFINVLITVLAEKLFFKAQLLYDFLFGGGGILLTVLLNKMDVHNLYKFPCQRKKVIYCYPIG